MNNGGTPIRGTTLPLLPEFVESIGINAQGAPVRPLRGRIIEVVGTLVKAILPGGKVGDLCRLQGSGMKEPLMAEVIGFQGDAALLMPLGGFQGLSSSTEVVAEMRQHLVPVGRGLRGRILDGLGNIIDSYGTPFVPEDHYPVWRPAPDPLTRPVISRPLSLGLRCLDGLLTCGEGQRMGIFAAAGGGKTTLLTQILRNTEADVVVLSLVGERGREVREFLDLVMDEETRKKCIVVVSTSDRPSMERLKCAMVATSVAEYFRDLGERVLLLVDSVTRFARAQRMVGLAAGEPPARRGFPPSVFSALPELMERAGPAPKGSITALYTVLVEGDDMNEPVADETRSILDGHIILSRELASANHYPAVDILESKSRVMGHIVSPEHNQAAGKVRSMMARYRETSLLIKIGEYKQGSDPETDEAIAKYPEITRFLRQGLGEVSSYDETLAGLIRLAS
jgi:type III secretion protein N (ATPase)